MPRFLRIGFALSAAFATIAVLAALWLTASISDRDSKRDVVPGHCVRAEVGSYERGLIPFYRDLHYAQIPILECKQLAVPESESSGSLVVGGLLLNLVVSLAVVGTSLLGIRRLLRRQSRAGECAV